VTVVQAETLFDFLLVGTSRSMRFTLGVLTARLAGAI
jgi:hypothetical protein